MTPPNATIATNQGMSARRSGRFRSPEAKHGPDRLADRQSDAGSQIEEAGQKLGIARSQKQLRERSRRPEQDGRRQGERERQATAGCATDEGQTLVHP